MSDLISRQAAIDVLDVGAELLRRVLDDANIVGAERAKCKWVLDLIEPYIADIKDLPSAQPEQCKDAVSKAKVLEAYADLYDVFDDNKGIQHELHKVFDRINNLPSAQPEQLERCPIYDGVCGYPSDQCYDCPRHHGAQPEQRWIPCSERLPDEEKGTYWVCTDTEYQCECRWTNVNHFWTELTTNWHWHIMDIPQYTKVIAWMPLPEPYKVKK